MHPVVGLAGQRLGALLDPRFAGAVVGPTAARHAAAIAAQDGRGRPGRTPEGFTAHLGHLLLAGRAVTGLVAVRDPLQPGRHRQDPVAPGRKQTSAVAVEPLTSRGTDQRRYSSGSVYRAMDTTGPGPQPGGPAADAPGCAAGGRADPHPLAARPGAGVVAQQPARWQWVHTATGGFTLSAQAGPA